MFRSIAIRYATRSRITPLATRMNYYASNNTTGTSTTGTSQKEFQAPPTSGTRPDQSNTQSGTPFPSTSSSNPVNQSQNTGTHGSAWDKSSSTSGNTNFGSSTANSSWSKDSPSSNANMSKQEAKQSSWNSNAQNSSNMASGTTSGRPEAPFSSSNIGQDPKSQKDSSQSTKDFSSNRDSNVTGPSWSSGQQNSSKSSNTSQPDSNSSYARSSDKSDRECSSSKNSRDEKSSKKDDKDMNFSDSFHKNAETVRDPNKPIMERVKAAGAAAVEGFKDVAQEAKEQYEKSGELNSKDQNSFMKDEKSRSDSSKDEAEGVLQSAYNFVSDKVSQVGEFLGATANQAVDKTKQAAHDVSREAHTEAAKDPNASVTDKVKHAASAAVAGAKEVKDAFQSEYHKHQANNAFKKE